MDYKERPLSNIWMILEKNWLVMRKMMNCRIPHVIGSSFLACRFYVCASGSSGTLAAGDYLKDKLKTSLPTGAVVDGLQ